MKKTSIYLKLLSFILSLFLAIPLNVVSALAASTTTEIKHESPEEYYPGFRIKLDAEVTDDVGVMVARCYFKTKKQENFVFVNMAQEPDSHYLATLPAPWVNSESIDYVFVVVNKEKKVVRSQVFTIEEEDTEAAATWEGMGEVKEIRLDVVQEAMEEYEIIREQLRAEVRDKLSEYQKDLDQGQLDVKTELDRASEKLRDFYDKNVVVSEVPDHLKYGLLAESLYTDEQINSAGRALAVAKNTGAAGAGSIKAGAGGLPWGWIALGTVAVGGGVAAAVIGGESNDNGSADPISVNPGTSGQIVVADAGAGFEVADDSFSIYIDGVHLFTTPLGGSSQYSVSNVSSGTHQLVITYADGGAAGTYQVTLQQGVIFNDGTTQKEGALYPIGDSRTFTIIVP